jgi:hypothetical protein
MRDIFAQGRTLPVSNPTYPMANLNSSSYAAPLMYNQPTETLGGYDAQVNPMTGQEVVQTNFAHGGLASLTQPSDDFAHAMRSGIAAYAGGGEVKHFKAGDIVRTGTLLPGVTPAGLITYQVGTPTPDPQRAADEKAVRDWFAQNVPAGTGLTPAAINQATGGNLTSADLARIGIGQRTGVFVPGNTAGTLNWSNAPSDDLDYITSLSASPEWEATQSNLWGRFLDRLQEGLFGGLGGLLGGEIAGPLGAKVGAEKLISAADRYGVDPHWLSSKLGGRTTLEGGKYVFTPSSGAPSVGGPPSDYTNTPEEYGGAGGGYGGTDYTDTPEEYGGAGGGYGGADYTNTLPEVVVSGDRPEMPPPERPYPIYDPGDIYGVISRPGPADETLPEVVVSGDRPEQPPPPPPPPPYPIYPPVANVPPITLTPDDAPGTTDDGVPSVGAGTIFVQNRPIPLTPPDEPELYTSEPPTGGLSIPDTGGVFRSAFDPMYSASTSAQYGLGGAQNLQDYLANLNQSLRPGPITPYRFQTAPERPATPTAPVAPQGIASVPPSGVRFRPELYVDNSAPVSEENPYAGLTMGLAGGGLADLGGTYRAGGKLLRGPGDGMSDSIPAVIHGEKTQRAALADGEFVIPADVVSHIGNGSTDAGSRKLYEMMDRVRKARTGRTRQAPAISPARYMPNA